MAAHRYATEVGASVVDPYKGEEPEDRAVVVGAGLEGEEVEEGEGDPDIDTAQHSEGYVGQGVRVGAKEFDEEHKPHESDDEEEHTVVDVAHVDEEAEREGHDIDTEGHKDVGRISAGTDKTAILDAGECDDRRQDHRVGIGAEEKGCTDDGDEHYARHCPLEEVSQETILLSCLIWCFHCVILKIGQR